MSTPAAAGRLLDLLKIEIPLIQAPMAGVSTPTMAAAVSGAGALGSLGLGASTPDQARGMIRAVRERTSRPFGVNLFVHQPARRDAAREAAWVDHLRPLFDRFGATPPAELREIYPTFLRDDAMLAMLLEERPAVVSFHFGLPDADRVRALRAAGITLVASATNLDEARQAVMAGMDAVVAQGHEAGGHRGVFDPDAPDDRLGTIALTRLLARDLAVPVIAAGGIMDGAGIAAVLALGAGAAQLGTAFVGADESAADAGYRAALKSGAAHHTTMTRAISGRPARSLANAFTRLGESLPPDAIPAYPVTYDAGKALNTAAKAAGDTGYGAQWAGQGAPLARFLPAAQIVAELAAELAYARRHG
ncbi:nitronate monooxygenase [Nitrospirillum sp. BR 11164]|uniref:NAD(P)H-dependent flavin oxidoreductase n=1 Tax=Nitrospirillum sp. BR 11164 TaxID=3104324 RepID=UPI002AFFA03C|nr:nitronate monooxygenase [Nitrospirillum sp. BR 11164]MEA1649810.1 nitronate monooxygenase [Nitrospirillum sp. BR 11164]